MGAGGPNGTAAIAYALLKLASGQQIGRPADMRSTGAAPMVTVNVISCQNVCVALPDPGSWPGCGHQRVVRMKVHGRCHCGELVYEAQVDPAHASICHCVDCQILTGTAYRVSVPAKAENFRILSGVPKIYVKTAESGNPRAQAFCATCGTPVMASDVKHPAMLICERARLPTCAAEAHAPDLVRLRPGLGADLDGMEMRDKG